MSAVEKQSTVGSLVFLRSWIRDPLAVGLPFPSSPKLAQRLALTVQEGAIPIGGPILELGPGTGVVTQALIQAGWPQNQIVVVESDAQLCRGLERRLPGVHVLHADALDIGAVAERAGLSSAAVVLSGLPMRAVAPKLAARCYFGAFKLLPPGGAIFQYTYGFRSPFNSIALPVETTFIGREWLNFPPVGIWRYRLLAEIGS